jgi:uncharacterized protein (DUF1697 family)
LPKYVALLRGINVGRNKRVAMEDLREILGRLGHVDVKTYLNSGNVTFTSRSKMRVSWRARSSMPWTTRSA